MDRGQESADILVATGGSPHSTVALTFAAHLATLCQAPLTVLAVIRGKEERLRGEAILERAHFVLSSFVHSIPYRTIIRVGYPAEEILAEAEAGDYRMIVVGEKQDHRFLTRFVLGSTAIRVIEHAPCPVVLVKGQIGPVRRILICESGQTQDLLVQRTAVQLPDLLASAESITILHVMSQMGAGPGIDGRQLRATAEELIREHAPEGEVLAQDLRILASSGYSGTAKVRHGLVIDEILDEASQGAYDLVIIGAHRAAGWRRILLDDLSHQLVIRLDRPVLVIR